MLSTVAGIEADAAVDDANVKGEICRLLHTPATATSSSGSRCRPTPTRRICG
ncbi:MAG: hypothetical protein R2715_08640 [Ilumatobacteraceae bacterium]